MRDPGTEREELGTLIEEARLYTGSAAFMQLLDFAARLPHIAPFNAMLLQIQRPGLSFAATRAEWKALFKRTPTETARPLVVLKSFGPVDFVYDIQDTDGPPLPPGAYAFHARGPVMERDIRELQRRLSGKRINIIWTDNGDLSAGAMMRDGAVPGEEMSYTYLIHVNRNHAHATQFATLAHELGHLCLGHLGPDKKLKVRERPDLTKDMWELEAESVSYLVCKRHGVETSSAAYLAEYVKANTTLGHLDVYQVMRAAGHVERILEIGGIKEEQPSGNRTMQGIQQ